MKHFILLLTLMAAFASSAQNSCTTTGDKKNGIYLEYYPDCIPKVLSYFKDGKPDSTYMEWKENGKLKVNGFYRNGEKDSVWRYYDKLLGYNNPKPNFNYMYAEYTYKNGNVKTAHDYLSFSDSIVPKSAENFIKYGTDTMTRRLGFHRNGTLHSEEFYRNGVSDSTALYWNENGELFLEKHFSKGKTVKRISYNASHKTIVFYRDGIKISLRQYSLTDKLLYEESYDKKGNTIRKKGIKQAGN